MFGAEDSYQSDLYQNIPSMAQMFALCSPIFGNGGFVIQPASPGEVQDGFPTLPYVPLEAWIYQAQENNSLTNPSSVIAGDSSGQHRISLSRVDVD